MYFTNNILYMVFYIYFVFKINNCGLKYREHTTITGKKKVYFVMNSKLKGS